MDFRPLNYGKSQLKALDFTENRKS
ncbi:MAG: hypothetical protein RIR98_538, partial [Bacteroidota bacterium]